MSYCCRCPGSCKHFVLTADQMCPGVAQSPSNNKKKKCSGTTGEYHVLTWIFQCMSAMKLLKKKKVAPACHWAQIYPSVFGIHPTPPLCPWPNQGFSYPLVGLLVAPKVFLSYLSISCTGNETHAHTCDVANKTHLSTHSPISIL